MTDNEFLRQKREREFQQRVLTALAKPKRRLVWEFVNSRLFSVIILASTAAAASGYFTQYQQCIRDADQTIDRWGKLLREVYTRQEALFDVVQRAASVGEVRNKLNSLPHVYSEFREASLFELTREQTKLTRSVDQRLTYGSKSDFPRPTIKYSAHALDRYGSISVGLIGREVADNEIDELKDYFSRIMQYIRYDWGRDRYFSLSPQCSLQNVAMRTLGYQTRYVVADPAFFQRTK